MGYRAAGLTTLAIALCFSDLKKYPKKDRWKVVGKKIFLTTLSERLSFNLTYHLAGSH